MASAAEKSVANAPGRRERNKLEKRARIVDAARDLFERQGFADTTTLQIAEAADIGTGTLFLYARSKEDLLIMVFKEEMQSRALQVFAKLPPEASPVDQMMSVFEQMVEYHARDADLARMLLRELVMPSSAERRGDIRELMDAIYGGLTEIANKAALADPALTAKSAFALYYYALLSWLGGGFDRDDCLRLLRRQLGGLILGSRKS